MLVSVGLFSLVSPFLLRRGPVVSCLENRGLAASIWEPNAGGGSKLTIPCENVYLVSCFQPLTLSLPNSAPVAPCSELLWSHSSTDPLS